MRRNMHICFVALILFTLSVGASQPEAHYTGGLGIAQFGDELYFSASFMPDISIGKLGVGLEVTLNVDENGIREQDWDDFQTILARTVRYVRWAHKGAPLYLSLGTLSGAQIGTGILVDSYSNLSPNDTGTGTRRIGLVADVDRKNAGLESMISDLAAPGVQAVRLYVRPTAIFPQLPKIVGDTTVGVSMARDQRSANPYDELTAVAVDAYYPINRALEVYAHAAHINDHGNGEGLGLRGNVGPLNYKAELRRMDADFVPAPFSPGYEGRGIDWADYPADGTPFVGYLLGAELRLLSGGLVLAAQHELNKGAVEPLPRFTASLLLQDVGLFFSGRPTSVQAVYKDGPGDYRHFGAKAEVGLMRGVSLRYLYDIFYPQDAAEERSISMGFVFSR